MCVLENSYDLETNSMEGVVSKWKMRKIIQRKMLQSRVKSGAMVRSSSANSAGVHNAILVIFQVASTWVGRKRHILSKVRDIIFVSGIPTYGRTVTNKRLTPSTTLGCAGCCPPWSRCGFGGKCAARLGDDVDSTVLTYLGYFTYVFLYSDCKIICPCKDYHVPMMFCKIHDVAEAAWRRERCEKGCHSELQSAWMDWAQDVPIPSCIDFDSKMLARAQRVSNEVQSKILMCALENSSDLETSSMEVATSKWKMRYIMHRRMLQSWAALNSIVRW